MTRSNYDFLAGNDIYMSFVSGDLIIFIIQRTVDSLIETKNRKHTNELTVLYMVSNYINITIQLHKDNLTFVYCWFKFV